MVIAEKSFAFVYFADLHSTDGTVASWLNQLLDELLRRQMKGERGERGIQGPKGDKGGGILPSGGALKGQKGEKGAFGELGLTGQKGDPGEQGEF